MKKFLAIFICFAFVLVSAKSSLAQDESAAMEPNVGYKGGFYMKNDEDSFRLTLGGRVQTKFYYQKQNVAPRNQATFQIRRATVSFAAKVSDMVDLGFTLMHANVGAANTTFQTVQVDGATAAITLNPAFVISAGMVGLPLDIMSTVSSAWFLLTEAPLSSSQDDGQYALTALRPSFGAPAGLGINLSGDYWKWFYSVSVVNGAAGVNDTESNYAINPNHKFSAGVRTGLNIFDPVPGSMTDFENSETPKFTVSVGGDYQGQRVDPNTGSNIKWLLTGSFGAAYRYRGFAINAEGYYRRTKITTIGTAVWARPMLTDIGYYASAGYYFVPKKFEVALQASQMFRQGPDNDSYQFGGGLNYYIFDNNCKLQLAYTYTTDFDDVTGTQNKNTQNIALMASTKF